MEKRDYDAIVVGSGPNGLAAAITLQQAGLKTLLVEGGETIGGGLRTASLTQPGFLHDICAAVFPLALLSPFYSSLDLAKHGLEFIYPSIAAAHPFDDGTAALIKKDLNETAAMLGRDADAYRRLIGSVVRDWPLIGRNILSPLQWPDHPIPLARFGLHALAPATRLAKQFSTDQARALFGGMAAHAMLPLSNTASSAAGLVLMAAAHLVGWPIAKGGGASIASALTAVYVAAGGRIETNHYIKSLDELPAAHAVLFDVGPKQLLQIAGQRFSASYTSRLSRYRYGMGIFKIDWALDSPVPFTNEQSRQAGTIHLGNTFNEIAAAEKMTAAGEHPEKPFVLLAQQSLFDAQRAPQGKQTLWGYCHTPNGSLKDMTNAIEQQVERFAPGFTERIIDRHSMNNADMEAHNPNYVGGDINGGIMDIRQLFTRPVLRASPYTTSARGLYICSASTPPGGGIHGMCGYHAAVKALKDVFKIELGK